MVRKRFEPCGGIPSPETNPLYSPPTHGEESAWQNTSSSARTARFPLGEADRALRVLGERTDPTAIHVTVVP